MSIRGKYFVNSIDSFQCKEWLLKKHYAKKIPSIEYSFGLFSDSLIGVCTFGQPASPNVNKGICGERFSKYVIELNRLIVNEGLEKNVLSYFVSNCLKKIKGKKIVVSYADSSIHSGYIYQATNFLYTGKGEPRSHLSSHNGKHPRHYLRETKERTEWIPKHRYIFFIGNKNQIKEMKNELKYSLLPYPKEENKNYDASYQPTIQKQLF